VEYEEYSIDEQDIDLNLTSGSLIEDSALLNELGEVRGDLAKVSVGHDNNRYNITGEVIETHPKVRLSEIGECLILMYRESTVAPTGFMRYIESLEGGGVGDLPLYIYIAPEGIGVGDVDGSIIVQRVVSHVRSPDSLALLIYKLGGLGDSGDMPCMELWNYKDGDIGVYSNFKLRLDYRY
jgi:hypothetical protein